jgi:hypothetical protein
MQLHRQRRAALTAELELTPGGTFPNNGVRRDPRTSASELLPPRRCERNDRPRGPNDDLELRLRARSRVPAVRIAASRLCNTKLAAAFAHLNRSGD